MDESDITPCQPAPPLRIPQQETSGLANTLIKAGGALASGLIDKSRAKAAPPEILTTDTALPATQAPMRPTFELQRRPVLDEEPPLMPQPKPTLTLGSRPEDSIADPGATRPRIADEYGYLEKKDRDLNTMPVEKKNGKLKSALLGALKGAGEAATLALQSKSDNPLAAMIGGAAGGAIGGGVNDKWDEQAERNQEIAQNQQRMGFILKRRKAQADITGQEAETDLKRAQAEAARRPKVEKPTYRKHNGVVYRITAQGAEPLTDMAGNMLPPELGEPKVREFLDEDGVTKILMQWNPETRAWDTVAVNGQKARAGYVQPVSPETGMTPAQEAADEDRDKAHEDLQQHRKVTESQGAQRITQGAQRLQWGGARQSGQDARSVQQRLSRAHQEVDEFEKLKSRAQTGKESERATYLQQAKAKAEALRATYGDVVEVGESHGWPYVKMRSGAGVAAPTPSATPAKGRVSRAKFRTQNPRYKDADDAAVDAAIRNAGYLPY